MVTITQGHICIGGKNMPSQRRCVIYFFYFRREKRMLIIFPTLNNSSVVPSEVKKEQREGFVRAVVESDLMHFN